MSDSESPMPLQLTDNLINDGHGDPTADAIASTDTNATEDEPAAPTADAIASTDTNATEDEPAAPTADLPPLPEATVLQWIEEVVQDPDGKAAFARPGLCGAGFTLKQLQACARHLQLPTSKPKKDLVAAIVKKSQNMVEIAAIVSAPVSGGSFIKNKNTVPRLLNCFLADDSAIAGLLNGFKSSTA